MRDLRKIREKVVIRLEHRQMAYAIIGCILVSIGTFTSGVFVGKQMSDAVPSSLAAMTGVDNEGLGLESPMVPRQRVGILHASVPSTQSVHRDLGAARTRVQTSDPGSASRIETHRQLALVRAKGSARSLGPMAKAPSRNMRSPAASAPPVNLVQRDPAAEKRAFSQQPAVATKFALQVSAFNRVDPAQVVANELKRVGHRARVREVAKQNGQLAYRVEVGQFSSARDATVFQRRFERKSGYSTVLVPIL
jgi:cell division septation protein DedD